MRLREYQDILTHTLHIELEITDADQVACRLDPWDMRLAEECGKSNSLADKLLWLETLARRIEEQRAPEDSRHASHEGSAGGRK